MIYLQPITFYAIMREMPHPDRTEIAEHPDGAMKAYASRHQANEALREMWIPESEPFTWRVDEILLVPPPMTSAYHHDALKREIDEVKRAVPAHPKVEPGRRTHPTKRKVTS